MGFTQRRTCLYPKSAFNTFQIMWWLQIGMLQEFVSSHSSHDAPATFFWVRFCKCLRRSNESNKFLHILYPAAHELPSNNSAPKQKMNPQIYTWLSLIRPPSLHPQWSKLGRCKRFTLHGLIVHPHMAFLVQNTKVACEAQNWAAARVSLSRVAVYFIIETSISDNSQSVGMSMLFGQLSGEVS